MPKKQIIPEISEDIKRLRRELEEDEERTRQADKGEFGQEWVNIQFWSKYTGADSRPLYKSYSDEELLDILRSATAELGRLPMQKEIFCVYRSFIRRRFKNWSMALRAAGLKEPKKKKEKQRSLH
mgnify:CR=1 FL=1